MAKAKDKKSSDKTKKSTGTKLTKSVKKTAKKSGLMDLLGSNLGREILADALIAAAGAAAAALTKTRPAKQAGTAVADAGSQAADLTQTAAGAVAGVVTEAARQFLPAGLLGEDEGSDKAGKSSGKKVKYVHRTSDHSTRKQSKKNDKAEKR
jgi:hypothetical protein